PLATPGPRPALPSRREARLARLRLAPRDLRSDRRDRRRCRRLRHQRRRRDGARPARRRPPRGRPLRGLGHLLRPHAARVVQRRPRVNTLTTSASRTSLERPGGRPPPAAPAIPPWPATASSSGRAGSAKLPGLPCGRSLRIMTRAPARRSSQPEFRTRALRPPCPPNRILPENGARRRDSGDAVTRE